jgi:hypothetical protein
MDLPTLLKAQPFKTLDATRRLQDPFEAGVNEPSQRR